MEIKITKDIAAIFERFASSGYEAFLVGGCVRDALMGLTPHDYDFTTNATPEQVHEIFADYHRVDDGDVLWIPEWVLREKSGVFDDDIFAAVKGVVAGYAQTVGGDIFRVHTEIIAGDGQVTMGESTIMKNGAKKVRKIFKGTVLTGFAGSVADAFSLTEKFEKKLEEHGGNLKRAAVDLAQLWRSDKGMRSLEALMIVVDKDSMLVISGNETACHQQCGT